MEFAISILEDGLSSYKNGVFTLKDIQKIVDELNEQHDFTELKVNDVLIFLLSHNRLKKVVFEFPQKKTTRYIYGDASKFHVLSSLFPEGYLSHYSALLFHNLAEPLQWDNLYISKERSRYPATRKALKQSIINKAFLQDTEISNYFTYYNEHKVHLLTGTPSNHLGVVNIDNIKVTDLERTLIDITVQPMYGGGILQVLKAYENSRGRASVEKLKFYLEKLNYTFPYHQAVGFYLESSGFPAEEVAIMKDIPISFDFYLSRGTGQHNYSEQWRVFYEDLNEISRDDAYTLLQSPLCK